MKAKQFTVYAAISVTALACVFLFQNCAEDINYDEYSGGAATGSSTAPGGTTPSPGPGVAAPVIINKSNNIVIEAGESFNINVNASGTGLEYQWYKGSTRLTSETNNSFGYSNAKVSDTGTYNVVVTNDGGFVEASIVVTVNQVPVVPPPTPTPTKPKITNPRPDIGLIISGATITPQSRNISVSHTGGTKFEWWFKSYVQGSSYVKLSNTSNSINLQFQGNPNLYTDVIGDYKVRVSNSAGYVEDEFKVFIEFFDIGPIGPINF